MQSNVENTLTEIHTLAYYYHWARKDLWEMPCTERRVFFFRVVKQLKDESDSYSGTRSHTPSKYKESR